LGQVRGAEQGFYVKNELLFWIEDAEHDPIIPRGVNGLPVAMERKLALRKSAVRECLWNGATRPSKPILELQVAANQHIRVFVVKLGEIYFLTSAPGAHLLLIKGSLQASSRLLRLLHL
jgi:hypothetical protein